jgi:hypothetical protein
MNIKRNEMKSIKTLPLSIFVGSFILTGCQSTSNDQIKQYEAWVAYEFNVPEKDNRFPNKLTLSSKSGRKSVFLDNGLPSNGEFYLNPQSIVRCDDPITVCKHGIINPIVRVEYNKQQISSGKMSISGELIFEVAKNVKRESSIGYTELSISDGFPLLPQETVTVPFTGLTGGGEIIEVTGPYESSFSISVKFKDGL